MQPTPSPRVINPHQSLARARAVASQYHRSPGVPIPSTKSRGIYIALGVLLGYLGIHDFYAGHYARGLWILGLNVTLFWTIIVPLAVLVFVVVELFCTRTDGAGAVMAL